MKFEKEYKEEYDLMKNIPILNNKNETLKVASTLDEFIKSEEEKFILNYFMKRLLEDSKIPKKYFNKNGNN